MGTFRKLALGLARDSQGNIMPMAAASLLVMAALVGGGVDMSRAYRVQNRLQNACDAGVLAGRRAVTNAGFDVVSKAQAAQYFKINFDETQQDSTNTTVTFTSDAAGNSITGNASTKMNMLIMQLFNQPAMTITATCTSTMGAGNADIMMVLDVTGSMASPPASGGSTSKISALKTAVNNFYATLATATSGSNARVRYGFVPYSTTVNVGGLLYNLSPSYLKDTMTIQSRQARFETTTMERISGWTADVKLNEQAYTTTPNSAMALLDSATYLTETGCNQALPADTGWVNNGSSSTSTFTTSDGSGHSATTTKIDQPQKSTTYMCMKSGDLYKKYYYNSFWDYNTYSYAVGGTSITVKSPTTVFDHWDYKPVTYDSSQYKLFQTVDIPVGSNGTNVSTSWDGCIEERSTISSTSFSFSTITGMSPADATDLDIDTAPDGNQSSKWAPLWRPASYGRNSAGVATSGWTPSSFCVPAAQGLQSMSAGQVSTYVNSLTAQGNTYLDIGMLWGARLISDEGIFQSTVTAPPSNGAPVNKHVIFMTDGIMDAGPTTYQSYGIESIDMRTTADGSDPTETANHTKRFRAMCDAIKNKGVRIWVIDFNGTGSVGTDLAYCSSPNSAFAASSAAQLNAAFQSIAKQVGELRVLQ